MSPLRSALARLWAPKPHSWQYRLTGSGESQSAGEKQGTFETNENDSIVIQSEEVHFRLFLKVNVYRSAIGAAGCLGQTNSNSIVQCSDC